MSSFLNALPGAISQGLVWGIMAIGLYITYKLLDIADLTVDGSFCTGGAVGVVLITSGCNVWVSLLAAILAGMLAGLVTGLLHTACGIPAILSGILTQLGLWSVNLAIMGMKANQSLNVNKYDLLVSLRYLQDVTKGTRGFWQHPIFVAGLFTLVIIAVLYWFFGTSWAARCARRVRMQHGPRPGHHTNLNKVLGLMISNGLVALSGALLSQYQSLRTSIWDAAPLSLAWRRDYRRSHLWKDLSQLRPEAPGRSHRLDHLLCGHSGSGQPQRHHPTI